MYPRTFRSIILALLVLFGASATVSADIIMHVTDDGSGGTTLTVLSGTGTTTGSGTSQIRSTTSSVLSSGAAATSVSGGFASSPFQVSGTTFFKSGAFDALQLRFVSGVSVGSDVSELQGATLTFATLPFLTAQNLNGAVFDAPSGANLGTITFTAAVPEPSSVALLSIAGLGACLVVRRKRRQSSEAK